LFLSEIVPSEILIYVLFIGVFTTFGLIGVIPALHYGAVEGFFSNFTLISLGWLLLMGFLYISGALLYALRVPERFFPGKCDLLVRIYYNLLN